MMQGLHWPGDVQGHAMRLLCLLVPLTLLGGCASTSTPGPAHVSCQPYGDSPVPITFDFPRGATTAASAEQTAISLIRSCAATPDASSLTITITDLTSNATSSTGDPNRPNAGQTVWLVQIDTTETVAGGTYQAHYLVDVNQGTGVPTLIAYG